MEETEKMDLSLSVDFDSSLLNWSEDVSEMSAAAAGETKKGAKADNTAARISENSGFRGVASTELSSRGFMRLPSFHVEGEGQKATTTSSASPSKPPANNTTKTVATTAVAAPPAAPQAGTAWANPSQFNLPPHLYRQLQSGSTAPQPQQQQAVPQHLVVHPYVMAQAGTGVPHNSLAAASAAYMGAVATPAVAAPAVKNTDTSQPEQQQVAQQATSVSNAQLHPLALQSSVRCGQQPGTYAPMVFNPLLSVTQTVAASNSFMSMLQQQPSQPQAAAPQVVAPAVAAASTTTNQQPTTQQSQSKSSQQSSADAPPPFLLFDAPCELRTNFIQSQRMHGLPITQDNNSYHYGMAVNGFHPQVNAQDNPILPLSTSSNTMANVQLVDGRHHRNKRGGARERNEREQKRAQKITELIEKLRLSIEKGGWRVELKSKYHTLTTCADYVKHLIKTTQEKEAAVEQAKLDLTVKECKLAEDKAILEGRSDPESVASSLTASTTESAAPNSSDKVAKVSASSGSDDGNKDQPPPKKQKLDMAQENETADSSSSGEEGGPRGQNISLDKMSSSVSEITDSNREDGGNKSDQAPSSSSISSTAAVVRGEGSFDRPHGHADVVIKEKASKGKRKQQELTSLERNFQLDYEEVFLTSNVPQLIATPTGKIVVCNDFFLKATGLTKEEAESMTIFSIVEADNLSNLFEMIGQALKRESSVRKDISKQNESPTEESTKTTDQETTNSKSSSTSRVGDYAALTLPCITFPATKKRRSGAGTSHHPNPLYMTVTLMADEDPRKRCFHCVLTDCPGTNGALGSITTELLTLLFTEPDSVVSSGSTFKAKSDTS